MINVLKLIAGNYCKPYSRLGHIGTQFSNLAHWLEFEIVVGTIGLVYYLEGGAFVFLFTLAEWRSLEERRFLPNSEIPGEIFRSQMGPETVTSPSRF